MLVDGKTLRTYANASEASKGVLGYPGTIMKRCQTSSTVQYKCYCGGTIGEHIII